MCCWGHARSKCLHMTTWELSTLKDGHFDQNFPKESIEAFTAPFLLVTKWWNFATKRNTNADLVWISELLKTTISIVEDFCHCLEFGPHFSCIPLCFQMTTLHSRMSFSQLKSIDLGYIVETRTTLGRSCKGNVMLCNLINSPTTTAPFKDENPTICPDECRRTIIGICIAC
jgi:hypothetical protein